jgi:hypothetical protein
MATLSLKVREQTFAVDVDERGRFSLNDKDPTSRRVGYVGRYDTLEALRVTLMARTKRQTLKVNIQATLLAGPTPTPLTVVGRNQSTHKLIVRMDGRRQEQDFYGGFFRPLTPEEAAEWERLYVAAKDATRALEAFKKDKGLNVRGIVEAAEKALDAEAAAEARATEAAADARAAGADEQ